MTDDDADLFRRAVSGAKPLKSDDRIGPSAKKPRPKARFSRADAAAVMQESLAAPVGVSDAESGEFLRFSKPSVDRMTMRKLQRGRYTIQAEIDLHGMTVAQAKPRLAEFLEDCVQRNQRCVRVVHGKGRGSGMNGPVLKQSVDRWLRQWDTVLAFVSAPQADGGTGAVYVLLEK